MEDFDDIPLPPWEGPAILLVDLDAFFASVEQLDHPGWRGKPVIVGGDPHAHGVVSTCSYEARAFGVRSAMAASLARSLCPDAIWTHGSFHRYRQVSAAIMAILRDETPRVQQVSIDEAFMDVTPTAVNTEHPVRIARRIQERVAALGRDCSPVEEDDTVKSVSNEVTFAEDLTERADIEAALATIAAKVGRRLRRKGLAGRTVAIKVRFADRTTHSVQRSLAAPTDDDIALIPLLHAMIDDIWLPGARVRLLGVAVSNFHADAVVQESLFDGSAFGEDRAEAAPLIGDATKRRDLLRATDALRDRFGDDTVRFGFELRNAGNTTGSSSKNVEDYK